MISNAFLEDFERGLAHIIQGLKEDLQSVRSNRPSVELLENIKVNYYDQWITVKQLGSLSVQPPRDVLITVWDKNALGAAMKAIEAAKIGYTVTNNDTVIRASLPPLTDERREELAKVVKKTIEQARIQVRGKRDEANKHVKAAEDAKEMSNDQSFTLKERIQKAVNAANTHIETVLQAKLQELDG